MRGARAIARTIALSSMLLWSTTSIVTKVFAQSNTAIPALATNAANINGRWRGRYLCGQGFTGVTLNIKQIKTDVTAEFDLYPLPENPGVPRGVALYQGSFDQTSRQIILRGVKWLKQPAPGWIIVDFSGGFDSQFRSFSGRKLNPSCGNIDLARVEESKSTKEAHPCKDDRIDDSYNTNDPKYHSYSLTNGICSKTLKGCTREKVFQTMISQEQFIVPSPLDDTPVVNCREKTLPIGNPIRTTINSNDYSITNYTLPGHMFHPGKITRRVTETNNAITVTTIGEGVGDYKKINVWVAPDIWSRADTLLSVRVRLILSNRSN